MTLADRWYNRPSRWLWVGVFLAALVAYWPVLSAGFIWDDAGHVTRPELRSLGGLGRIWFELGATQQYYPLLHSAFWLESHLWGDSAAGYHLINVLLHALAAGLLATTLRRLAIPGGWIAAFLFVLHPVAVESVAWISEQKNTLSTVLYLCAALSYLRFDADRRPRHYAVATILFFAALCTKTVSATLPAALLVVFWWQRGRLDARRDLVPLGAWLVLGAIGGAVTSHVEHTLIGAKGADFPLDLVERVLLAGRVIWFYLGKLVWPVDLMFMYPRWTVDSAQLWQCVFPLAAAALAGGLWWTRRRGALAAYLFFVGSLFPALGFVNVYPFIFSFVADHFQYLADLGFWAFVGAGAAALIQRSASRIPNVILATVLVAFGVVTWRQTQMYHDEFSLYETTLAKNPASWMAHNNLGIALANNGRSADAIAHYEAALKLRPRYAECENNLGYELTVRGHPADALPHFDRALAIQSNYPEAHNNRGIALIRLDRRDEGKAEFEHALRLNPLYPEAHLNLGLALAESGKTSEALPQFAEAVRLRPEYAEAELNWAIGLALSDRYGEAFAHFKRAIELNPGLPDAHHMYGRALARAGQYDEAIAEYHQAIELNPNFADAHLNLAIALKQAGHDAEAEQEILEARRLGAGR